MINIFKCLNYNDITLLLVCINRRSSHSSFNVSDNDTYLVSICLSITASVSQSHSIRDRTVVDTHTAHTDTVSEGSFSQ